MITHVAAFTWKPDMPDGQSQRIVEALMRLPALVASIRSYSCGPDLGASELGNHDFAVVATFDDIEGWKAYDGHPEHERVRTDLVRPWIAARASVQFESRTAP